MQQCISATVHQCNSATVQQCNSASVQQCSAVHCNSSCLTSPRGWSPALCISSPECASRVLAPAVSSACCITPACCILQLCLLAVLSAVSPFLLYLYPQLTPRCILGPGVSPPEAPLAVTVSPPEAPRQYRQLGYSILRPARLRVTVYPSVPAASAARTVHSVGAKGLQCTLDEGWYNETLRTIS
jgi:hypothetical protein